MDCCYYKRRRTKIVGRNAEHMTLEGLTAVDRATLLVGQNVLCDGSPEKQQRTSCGEVRMKEERTKEKTGRREKQQAFTRNRQSPEMEKPRNGIAMAKHPQGDGIHGAETCWLCLYALPRRP